MTVDSIASPGPRGYDPLLDRADHIGQGDWFAYPKPSKESTF